MLALAPILAFSFLFQAPAVEPRTLVDCKEPITHAAVDSTGKVLVVATKPGDLFAFALPKATPLWTVLPRASHRDTVQGSLTSLAVGESNVVLTRHSPVPEGVSLEKGTELPMFMGVALLPKPLKPRAIALDPDDKWFWVAYEEGVVVRHAPSSPNAYSRRQVDGGKLTSVDTEGKLVAIGCEDGSIRFADVSNAAVDEKKVFQGGSSAISALRFAGRSGVLVSGAKDGSVRTWNVVSGKAKYELSAGSSPVVAIAIHPKGKWFATGDSVGGVRVWSLEKGAPLAEFPATSQFAMRGVFVLDGGKTLAVARGGPTVVAYDVAKL